MQSQITLRPMTGDDAVETLRIFQSSIREVAAADYDADQIETWATAYEDPELWWRSFAGSAAWVAADVAGVLVGFVNYALNPTPDIPAGRAYLDRLYVAPKFQGRGAATALVHAAAARLIKDHPKLRLSPNLDVNTISSSSRRARGATSRACRSSGRMDGSPG